MRLPAGLKSSCVVPRLYETLVTQPLPKATLPVAPRVCAETFADEKPDCTTDAGPCALACRAIRPRLAHGAGFQDSPANPVSANPLARSPPASGVAIQDGPNDGRSESVSPNDSPKFSAMPLPSAIAP